LDFDSARVDTAETLRIINDYHTQHQYVLCPHSAVGVAAIHQLRLVQTATVCLATAHEGKFPDAVHRAILGSDDGSSSAKTVANPPPPPPPELAALRVLPTRRTELPNNVGAVQAFVEECVLHQQCKKSMWGRWQTWNTSTKSLVTAATVIGVRVWLTLDNHRVNPAR
jgi:threonine synthase